MLVLREAAAAIRRTPLLTFLTAVVIAISLALIGLFVLFTVRASETLDDYGSKLSIEAYFDPAVSSDSAALMSKPILSSLPSLATSTFVSKEEAVKEYAASSGEDIEKVVGYNPLPAGLRMTFKGLTIAKAEQIVHTLKSSAAIKDVLFDGKTLRSLEERKKTLITITYFLGSFLVLVSMLLSASLARLAMESRRDAIRAMSLLGARRSTIVMPYYIEGSVAGFLGGLAASGAIIALHNFALPRIAAELQLAHADSEDTMFLILCSAILGALLGMLGSFITSLRLKVA